MSDRYKVMIVGAIIGAIAVFLTVQGNPANMGICTACFIRDTAGALGLHQAAPVQFVRLEIMGIVMGVFLVSILADKKSSGQGGSSPFTRFILGICVMIGALIFLGCPLRMIIRIGGGDLNAIVGLVGFVVGIVFGVIFLKKGFSLKKSQAQPKAEKYIFVVLNVIIAAMFILLPTVFFLSAEGPGSMHAPLAISLIAGLIVGALAYRNRICFVSGVRDYILFKDYTMILGLVAMVVVIGIGNIMLGSFNFGFEGQPIAHTDGFFNFGGLFVVGFASTLLGGCPLRQLVLASSGNSDSAVTVIGLLVGAAIAHNFGLASSAEGTTPNGQIAFWVILVVVTLIAVFNTMNNKKGAK